MGKFGYCHRNVGLNCVGPANNTPVCRPIVVTGKRKGKSITSPLDPTADIATAGPDLWWTIHFEDTGGPREREKVGCDTVLPNGKTLGETVRAARAQLLATQSRYATGLGGVSRVAATLAHFASIVAPNGPIDFKNNYPGNRELLGNYGNFAYYSIGLGIISDFYLYSGAGAYGIYSVITGTKPFSDLTGPMLSDLNAAAVRDKALASEGCPK